MVCALADLTPGSVHGVFIGAPFLLGKGVIRCDALDDVIDGFSGAGRIPVRPDVNVEAYARSHPPGVAMREAASVPSP